MQSLSRNEAEVDGPATSRSVPCPLCGQARRTHLFVLGRTRVTRCDECLLISRSDEVPRLGQPESYALDEDSERIVHGWLSGGGARRRVLQVVDGANLAARLAPDPELEVVTVTSERVLSGQSLGPFDGAFVNGGIEVASPLELLRRVRAALRPGADLALLVGSSLAQEERRIAPHTFSPPPLTRLTLAAGFRPRRCGILARRIGTPARDPRLVADPHFERTARLLSGAGRPVEVSSGLLVMHAQAEPRPERPMLSIIMPVFDEARTFRDTFERVYASRVEGVDREIVIVESNSSDGSRELVREVAARPGVRILLEDRPRGKGHAVRAAIAACAGDLVLIQDADSEYDVGDYDIVLGPLLNLSSTFVLGSRHLGGRTWKIRKFSDQMAVSYVMNLAHESLTLLANSLYGTSLRDPTTMYKAFRREAYEGTSFTRDRFDFDWELVCKLVRRGHLPIEVPVNYWSRSFAEGKKVRFFGDPWSWVETIFESRFEPLERTQ